MQVLCSAEVCNIEKSELMHMTLKPELKHVTLKSELN